MSKIVYTAADALMAADSINNASTLERILYNIKKSAESGLYFYRTERFNIEYAAQLKKELESEPYFFSVTLATNHNFSPPNCLVVGW